MVLTCAALCRRVNLWVLDSDKCGCPKPIGIERTKSRSDAAVGGIAVKNCIARIIGESVIQVIEFLMKGMANDFSPSCFSY